MRWKNLWLKLLEKFGKRAALISLSVVVGAGSVGAGVGAGTYRVSDYDYHSEEEPVVQIIEPEPEEVEMAPEIDALFSEEEEEETDEVQELTMVATSIEKDLKIKIQNQKNKLVTGEEFHISVLSDKKGAKASEYKDDDKDGIIYIKEIAAGDYTVTLEKIEGYEIKTASIKVTVKDQIEYKKVDVADEIKKESEVNTAVEDTAVNDIPVESNVTPVMATSVQAVSKDKVTNKPSYTETEKASAASVSSEQTTVTFETTQSPQQTSQVKKFTSYVAQLVKSAFLGMEVRASETGEGADGETGGDNGGENGGDNGGGTGGETGGDNGGENSGEETGGTEKPTAPTEYKASLPKSATLYDSASSASGSAALTLSVTPTVTNYTISWTSSDENVCKVAEQSGLSAKIAKVGKGSATVTATIQFDLDGTHYQAAVSCAVTVNAVETEKTLTNGDEVLTDNTGATLYVDENASTVAKVKNYDGQDVFYKVVSNGNVGIDVSKYQGSIDWSKVAASGISYVIIRAGYRGASQGSLVVAPYFKQNIQGATKAGLKVGVYFFTQAVNEAEAVEEASMVLSLVSGYRLALPIFIDTENASGGRANGLGVSARTAVCQAFCKTIQNGGYKAGVYASKSWFLNKLNASSLSGYHIWVAQYNSTLTYTGKHDIWQYTSSGSVNGISGKVDMNIAYTSY